MATAFPAPSGKPFRVGLAGLGTVGAGVVRVLAANGGLIAERAGRPIRIVAVSARDKAKARGVDLAPFAWEGDMAALPARADVDAVVELVGEAGGAALALARDTLRSGKSLVTANKAMVAHHGVELARLAEQHGAALGFEAAVAGGVPVVKGLREGTAATSVQRIYGILNGTSNYILSAMEDTGAEFAATLAQAQALGYAEADPAFDIEGIDAAHKLAILAAIGFGARTHFAAVAKQGIAAIRAADIAQARALGFVIRLIGMADLDAQGSGEPRLLQRVRPCLVPRSHPLAAVDGPTNAVVIESDFGGRLLFQGPGAGGGPTASAVVADLIDLARGDRRSPFSVPTARLRALAPADPGHRTGRAYLRFAVADRPGVLAEITAAMRDAGVSMESLIQQGQAADGGEVLVAMVTHRGPERCITEALALLEGSTNLLAQPLVLPILAE